MGRTGQAENSQANTQMSAIQQDQVARANAAQDKYNADLKTIQGGGNIGANPFANPQYLANQNLVSASAAHATNAGEAESLDQAAQRSGENTASTPYLKAILGANRERAMTDTAASQAQSNYQNNLDWQKMLLGSDLAPTGVDTSMFSTATSGRDASLGNLTQLGLASYGPVNALIGAAGAAAGAAAKGCWIAERLYGIDDRRTYLLRFWLNNVWAERSRIGRLVMTLYVAIGQNVAKSEAACTLLRPLFEKALRSATAWKMTSLGRALGAR